VSIVEDVRELEFICKEIKKLTKAIQCSVDKKRKRIAIAPSFGTMSLIYGGKRNPIAGLSGLMYFEQALQLIISVLEQRGYHLIPDGTSAFASLFGIPLYYYKVVKSPKETQK